MGCQRHCQRLRPAVEKVVFFHLRDANDDSVNQSARTQIATMRMVTSTQRNSILQRCSALDLLLKVFHIFHHK